MKRWWQVAVGFVTRAAIIVSVFVAISAPLVPAFAQTAPSDSRAISAVPGTCPQGADFVGPVVMSCDCYPGLANRVVGCIRQTLANASEVFLDPNVGFHSMLVKAISAGITIAIAIFGVMLASGLTERIGRDTFTLLLKVALITYFVVNTQLLYDMILAAIDSLADAMFQFSSGGLFGVCIDRPSVWERMDCMIDSAIGIRGEDLTAASFQGFNDNFVGDTIERGLIATFFEIMKSSSFGFVIGAMGMVFIYTMVFFTIRVLFAFLMSFISLTFLMIIAPMFIPLVLFRTTKQYFDKWIRLIIASSLQPVLLVAFITFAVAGIDLALFTGPTSITRVIAGDAAAQPGFSLNQYIDPFIIREAAEGPETKGDRNTDDFARIKDTVKGVVDVTRTECLSNTIGFVTQSLEPQGTTQSPQNGLQNFVECSRGKVNQLPYDSIDLVALAEARVPPVVDPAVLAGLPDEDRRMRLERQMTQEIFASVAIAVTLMFLMFALMRVVPVIANDLTGDYQYTPGFFNAGNDRLGSSVSRQISASFAKFTK